MAVLREGYDLNTTCVEKTHILSCLYFRVNVFGDKCFDRRKC